MRLKCIKQLGAWWGVFYEVDNVYEVIEYVNREVSVVFDNKNHDKLTNEILRVGSKIVEIHKKYKEKNQNIGDIRELKLKTPEYKRDIEYLDELVRRQKIIGKAKSEYSKRISLPFVIVKSEMEKEKDAFCTMTKQEVMEKYNLETLNIRTTTYFLEDYFIDVAEERNKKLNKIGI